NGREDHFRLAMTIPPPNPIVPDMHKGLNIRQPLPSASSVQGGVKPEEVLAHLHFDPIPGRNSHTQSTHFFSPSPPPPPSLIILPMTVTSFGNGTGQVQWITSSFVFRATSAASIGKEVPRAASFMNCRAIAACSCDKVWSSTSCRCHAQFVPATR